MLKSLHIKNFAIIEELALDFFAGLSVLSGETGAGKSIIIDAIGLVLGDRADHTLIRADKDAAEIALVIEADKNSASAAWLKAHDFEHQSECILRRVMRRDGKSRAYLNNMPVPLKTLKGFGENIINIYGQHAHQSLIHTATQRQLLDRFAGHKQDLDDLQALFNAWKQLNEKVDTLSKNAADGQSTIELLGYQVAELDQLGLQENEIDHLEKKHRRLAGAEELKQLSRQAGHQLKNDQGDDLHGRLHTVCSQVNALLENGAGLQATRQSLEEAFTIISECAVDLIHYADSIEVSPEQLFETEQRLNAIDGIARKHKVSAGQLTDLHKKLSRQLSQLTEADNNLEALQARRAETENQYRRLAAKVSAKRKRTAGALSSAISQALARLGMQKARVEIAVHHQPAATPGASGCDSIVINVQTNPGQSMLPLSQVASGGELSRISLAIQMIGVDKLDVPVLIFDEVDSGVGGAVAEVVGKELRAIGEHRQVMCITHLAQVAANAHHHYRVNKQAQACATACAIEYLNRTDRITEIARMLGGITLTENTYQHAQEMLETGLQ